MVSAPQGQSEPGALGGSPWVWPQGRLVLKLIANSGMGQSSPDGFMGVEKRRGLCQRVTMRKRGLAAEQEGYL